MRVSSFLLANASRLIGWQANGPPARLACHGWVEPCCMGAGKAETNSRLPGSMARPKPADGSRVHDRTSEQSADGSRVHDRTSEESTNGSRVHDRTSEQSTNGSRVEDQTVNERDGAFSRPTSSTLANGVPALIGNAS